MSTDQCGQVRTMQCDGDFGKPIDLEAMQCDGNFGNIKKPAPFEPCHDEDDRTRRTSCRKRVRQAAS